MPSAFDLIGSLIFGVGSLVIGSLVARKSLRGWRQLKVLIRLLVALWFVGSGISELIVSGLESARGMTGAPSLATLNRWHAGADVFLLVWSIALVVALALWPLARQVWPEKPQPGVTGAAADLSAQPPLQERELR